MRRDREPRYDKVGGVPNTRQALIGRCAGREQAIDTTYLPGPLHAIVRDVWTMRLAEPPEPCDAVLVAGSEKVPEPGGAVHRDE